MDEKKRSGRSSLSGENWELAALKALAKSGLDAVAIEPLARELGVTKGSAYWHFKDRNDLLKAALHRWGRDAEAGGERLLAEVPDPRARHRVVLGLITKDPKKRRIEAAILAAAHDPVVRPYLKKVRAARLAYLEGEYREMGMSAEEARQAARLTYSVIMGMLITEWQAPETALSAEEWDRFLDFLFARVTGSPPPHSQNGKA
jgi:AcrR family transcriptional regulator